MRGVILRMIETDTLNNGKRINYAYGLDVEEDNGFRNIQHTGGWASFRTIITNYPDEHLAVIVLSPRACSVEEDRLSFSDQKRKNGQILG